jgi:hypothetical protein
MKNKNRHTFERGYMGRYWNDKDFKNLKYIREPITEGEISLWKSKGYDHVKSFTGSMYDNRNTMPDWIDRFRKRFWHYKNLTFTFYKMSTLEIMPEHVDQYKRYRELHNVKYENVVRILVMLEDWKPGHYLEIAGQGITNWIAGDYFIWEAGTPHAAANIGTEDRYTLQITGTKIEWDEVWRKLHWYNIPNLASKASSFDPYLANKIINKVPDKDTQPFYVYLYNEKITQLEHIKHDEISAQELNEKGVDIYLYEPLCSYIDGCPEEYVEGGTKHSMHFYSEFKGDEDYRDLRSDELDSILLYKNNNGLTNVRVHTCDYGVEKYYTYYTKNGLQLYEDDLFLISTDPMKLYDEIINKEFTTKFISLNWRYALHRHLIVCYLHNTDSAHISWPYKSDIEHLSNTPWIDLFNLSLQNEKVYRNILQGLVDINGKAPLCVDIELAEPTNHTHHYHKSILPYGRTIYDFTQKNDSERLETFYRDSFIDIVTESRFAQPTSNYSEKAYQAMFYRKPFIMVAPPFTLEYMKTHGFQTFGQFWDESYDTETNHEKRLLMIFELIDYINGKSIQELREMYEKMIPIIEHNFKLTNAIINNPDNK